MPYADPQKRLEHRRAWGSKRLRKASGHTIMPHGRLADAIAEARSCPGDEVAISYANQNSAGVAAWRFNNGFYGPGLYAATHGHECLLFAEPNTGRSQDEA